MAARPPRTDRFLLNALLTSEKLTRSEQSAFQGFFDDLVGGKIINLSPRQRLWVETTYEKYKIGDMVVTKRKQAHARIQARKTTIWDEAKPLRPPGK